MAKVDWLVKKRSSLEDGLALPEKLPFRGTEISVVPLTLSDIALFRQQFGSFFDLDLTDTEQVCFILWLTLRRSDPTLTDTQKLTGQFNLSIEDVADSITLHDFVHDEELMALVRRILELSGLYQEENAEQNAKNAEAPARKRKTPSSGA